MFKVGLFSLINSFLKLSILDLTVKSLKSTREYRSRKQPRSHHFAFERPKFGSDAFLYELKCNFCDWSNVGYTRQHLFQRITEHKYPLSCWETSSRNLQRTPTKSYILKKCRVKVECSIYEMLLIKKKKPTLDTQADSNREKIV